MSKWVWSSMHPKKVVICWNSNFRLRVCTRSGEFLIKLLYIMKIECPQSNNMPFIIIVKTNYYYVYGFVTSKPTLLHQWPLFIIQVLPPGTKWEDHLFFFEWNFECTTWQFVCNMEPMYTSKILNQPFGSIQVHMIMVSIVMNKIRQRKKLHGIQQHMPWFVGRFKDLWVNGYYKHWAISLSGRLSPN